MRWPSLYWSLGLLTSLLTTGCFPLNAPQKAPPDPSRGLLADGYVPDAQGQPRHVPVVVSEPPPLPDVGPIELSLAECLDRAARVGRLDGESVHAWRLARKVGELGLTVTGSRYPTEELRNTLGLGPGAEVANLGFRIAVIEYQKKLAKMALAVERACWTLRVAQLTLDAAESPADRTQAGAAVEDAQITLGNLMSLRAEQARRLVLRDLTLPTVPTDPEPLLATVAEQHPDMQVARLREDIEKRSLKMGSGDGMLENRLYWLLSQQVITDTEIRLRNEGERLLRRWRSAHAVLAALRAAPGTTRKTTLEAERDLGLAQIDLARWLAIVAACQAPCPGTAVNASSAPSPAPG